MVTMREQNLTLTRDYKEENTVISDSIVCSYGAEIRVRMIQNSFLYGCGRISGTVISNSHMCGYWEIGDGCHFGASGDLAGADLEYTVTEQTEEYIGNMQMEPKKEVVDFGDCGQYIEDIIRTSMTECDDIC